MRVTRAQAAEHVVSAADEEAAIDRVRAEMDRPLGFLGAWKDSDYKVEVLEVESRMGVPTASQDGELVEMAQQLRLEYDRGVQLGLRDDELAFYDAVCQNDSAVMEMGDDVLKAIAKELVEAVRANTTVDWDKKEQVRALLRSKIRRLLVKYHYPPDKQEGAILLVMDQAERLASQVAA